MNESVAQNSSHEIIDLHVTDPEWILIFHGVMVVAMNELTLCNIGR
jgi:hypothetical protein